MPIVMLTVTSWDQTVPVLRNRLVQRARRLGVDTPPASLGRTMSLIALASLGIYPVSVALTGVLVSDLGPAPFFPLTAIIGVIALLAALTQAQFRNLGAESRHSDPSGESDRIP